MLEFKFCIDTGNTKTVCYRQPAIGIHEGKIMTGHIYQLENNNWIRAFAGPWGPFAKLQQESCFNIDKLVWRLCVSYRPINSVARLFEFPILRCSNIIENLGDSYGSLFFILLDARSSYHQIKIRTCDQKS